MCQKHCLTAGNADSSLWDTVSLGHCQNSPEVCMLAWDFLISIIHIKKINACCIVTVMKSLFSARTISKKTHYITLNMSQTQEICFFSLKTLALHMLLSLQILLDKIKLSEQFSETINILSTSTIHISFKRAEDL